MKFQYIKNTYHRNISEFLLFANKEKIKDNILDIGSGARRYDHYFSGTVTAVDIVPNAEHKVIYGNLDQRLDFANASFDSFICIEVLQYTQDFRQALSELARVLRPGGYGIVVAPHYYPEHGENILFASHFLSEELKKNFSEVETIRYGNFYTVGYDIIRLKIRTLSWKWLRVTGFVVWSFVARIIHCFVSEKKNDQFYSGTFFILKK